MGMEDLMGYDSIIEDSMRNIIHKILSKVQKEGLKGDHHFVISFATKYPKVKIPEYLKEKFNEEMTIVIQYQYDSLATLKDHFRICLTFSGKKESLEIPYNAVTSFADPSVNFGLKFSNYQTRVDDTQSSDADEKDVDLSAKIIDLDAFRKNKNKK